MKKRGQAAMEFLMTYGWAILVILIALASLYYLGIFDTETPSMIQFEPGPIMANDVKFEETGDKITMKLNILQGYTDIGIIDGMTVNGEDVTEANCVPDSGSYDALPTGEVTIACTTTGEVDLTKGEKVTLDIKIDATRSGGLDHTYTGTATGTVE